MNDQNLPSQKSTSGSDLEFSGKGGEFFGIWIVNILLSICTLGVYSAWAKVRTTNYFYGNTTLGGSAFVYTANPVSILKGRLIAFFLLGSYSLLSNYSPELSIGFIMLIALLSPVVIVRSLKFTFQNTEFRGLRFNFKGKVSEAYKIFLGGYLLAMVSLGILFPWWEKRRKEFFVGNIRFGTSEFSCDPNLRFFLRDRSNDYCRIYFSDSHIYIFWCHSWSRFSLFNLSNCRGIGCLLVLQDYQSYF